MTTCNEENFQFDWKDLQRFRIIDTIISDPTQDSSTVNIANVCTEELGKLGISTSDRTINDVICKLRAFIKKKLADELDPDDDVICEVKPHLVFKNGIPPEFLDECDQTDKVCRQVILDCLSNTNCVYNKTDLIAECNKQLETDGLKPIGYKRITRIIDSTNQIEVVPQCWRYTKPNFSYRNYFTKTDVYANFQELLIFLSKLPSDEYDWAEEAAENIKNSFHLPTITEDILSFDQSDNENIKSFFPEILTAIAEKKALHIWYKALNSNIAKQKEKEKDVHPYFLKQYGRNWQLYAKEEGDKLPFRQYNLNRIEDLSYSDIEYQPTDIDFNEHLKNVIGFTIPNQKMKVECVKLLVSEGKYALLDETKLHPSQKIVERKGNDYVVELNVVINNELKRLLLSHIDGVTVLEPASLKAKIESTIREALDNYNSTT